jgi:Dna[CI] antecedent DciA-like protein
MLRPLRTAIAEWAPEARTGGDPLGAIASAWTRLVGAGVAEHARPAQVVRETLVVVTRSSAWSQQLTFLSPKILEGLGSLEEGRAITKLRFRVGTVRATRRPRFSAPSGPGRATQMEPSAPLSADATPSDALQRFRRRLAVRRVPAEGACPECGAPHTGGGRCAPCAGRRGSEGMIAAQRLMYEAPWLKYAGTAQIVPGLERADYERWRRALLARWWEILQRARLCKRASKIERLVASSYLILHSALDPDRITPAIVRNLLGDELTALLFEKRG